MPQSPIIAWTAALPALNLTWRTVRYGLAFPISNDKEMIFVYRFDNMAANARGS